MSQGLVGHKEKEREAQGARLDLEMGLEEVEGGCCGLPSKCNIL